MAREGNLQSARTLAEEVSIQDDCDLDMFTETGVITRAILEGALGLRFRFQGLGFGIWGLAQYLKVPMIEGRRFRV